MVVDKRLCNEILQCLPEMQSITYGVGLRIRKIYTQPFCVLEYLMKVTDSFK